jgi:hypothetical protein
MGHESREVNRSLWWTLVSCLLPITTRSTVSAYTQPKSLVRDRARVSHCILSGMLVMSLVSAALLANYGTVRLVDGGSGAVASRGLLTPHYSPQNEPEASVLACVILYSYPIPFKIP